MTNLWATGIAGVAVVRDLMQTEDIETKTQAFLTKLDDIISNQYSMKIKEQTREVSQVAQSTALRLQIKLTSFEEIFEEYKTLNSLKVGTREFFNL